MNPLDRATWPELLTVDQVADILTIGRSLTRTLIAHGELERKPCGRLVFVTRRSIIEFLDGPSTIKLVKRNAS